MRCRTQFPAEFAPPVDLLNLLLATGWQDVSYGNDVSPSFLHPHGFVLWTDAADRSDRECQQPRYCLCRTHEDGFCHDSQCETCRVLWQCEETSECIRRLTQTGEQP